MTQARVKHRCCAFHCNDAYTDTNLHGCCLIRSGLQYYPLQPHDKEPPAFSLDSPHEQAHGDQNIHARKITPFEVAPDRLSARARARSPADVRVRVIIAGELARAQVSAYAIASPLACATAQARFKAF